MRALRLPCLFLAATLPSVSGGPQPTPRVFGGSPSPPTAYPAFATVNFRNASGVGFICGGFLVSPSFVMTAGHCVVDAVLSSFMVVLNGAQQVTHTAVASFTHPVYASSRRTNDVGLVQLASPSNVVPFEYARNGSLLASLAACAPIVVMGHGDTSASSGVNTGVLRVASLDFIPHTVSGLGGCVLQAGGGAYTKAQWPAVSVGDDVCLGFAPPCAGLLSGVNNTQTCEGDSGGPALSPSGVVIALVSRSDNAACGASPRPGIYTNIGAPENAAWIADVLQFGADIPPSQTPLFLAPPSPPVVVFEYPPAPRVPAWVDSPQHAIGVAVGAAAAFLLTAACVAFACVRPRKRIPPAEMHSFLSPDGGVPHSHPRPTRAPSPLSPRAAALRRALARPGSSRIPTVGMSEAGIGGDAAPGGAAPSAAAAAAARGAPPAGVAASPPPAPAPRRPPPGVLFVPPPVATPPRTPPSPNGVVRLLRSPSGAPPSEGAAAGSGAAAPEAVDPVWWRSGIM